MRREPTGTTPPFGIATSLSIDPEDFVYSPFAQRGGLGLAQQVFGEQLPKRLEELDGTLAD